MTRKEAQTEALRRNLERRDTGLWAAQEAPGNGWRVVRLITSGIGRRGETQAPREPRSPLAGVTRSP